MKLLHFFITYTTEHYTSNHKIRKGYYNGIQYEKEIERESTKKTHKIATHTKPAFCFDTFTTLNPNNEYSFILYSVHSLIIVIFNMNFIIVLFNYTKYNFMAHSPSSQYILIIIKYWITLTETSYASVELIILLWIRVTQLRTLFFSFLLWISI